MAPLSDTLACPVCGHLRSRVTTVRRTQVDLRAVDVWRKRQCVACQSVYTTLATERLMGPTHTVAFSVQFSSRAPR